MEDLKEQFSKFGDLKIKEPLRKHTTIRIGGSGEYFLTVNDLGNLVEVVKLALAKKIPYLVIGEGSNLVFSDSGFKGIVIKNETSDLIFERQSAVAESGITLYRLIRKLAEFNLGGLEFLTGIPGTLGGAIYGNAGAYGKSMSEVVENCTILDIDGEIKQFSNKEMGFDYRGSFLKTKYISSGPKPVILSAQIKISPNPKEAILRVVGNFIKIRQKKIPKGYSAGCFFKNIELKNLRDNINPQLKFLATDGKISAGLLIDKIDGKKFKVGKAAISEVHANFIINKSRAKAVDVKELAQLIKIKVRDRFGINLEEEAEFIGPIEKKKPFWEQIWQKK